MSDNSGPHVCVLCNNKLDSKEALKEHFRKHANKEIDSKGRQIGKNGEYIEPTPSRSKTYIKGSASKFINGEIICDVCGEGFKCNTMAIQHKFRKHPDSATKHFCPQCGMQFPLKIHRDNHLKQHTQHTPRNPYPCIDCGVVFYNRSAHEYHSRSTHERIVSLFKPVVTPPPSKKIKVNNAGDPQSVYYCHLCGFEYIVKFNLQKHLERQHTANERDNPPQDLIKCTTCDALFYSQKAYNNHNMYHKPDDLYVTSEQQRLQTVTRVDQDFDIRRVQTGAEKYIPVYRCRPKPSIPVIKKIPTKNDSSDEMSPASAIESSDDSDTENPRQKRIKTDSNQEAAIS
uniref:C2H2-type domain-containing protein n=1 Tax=Clastoptera arizonana TaxID=38151 RepID=A0A1B6C6U2_9HEMI